MTYGHIKDTALETWHCVNRQIKDCPLPHCSESWHITCLH